MQASTDFVRKRIACTSNNVKDDELRSQALNRILDLHAIPFGMSMLLFVLFDTTTDVLKILSDAQRIRFIRR